MILHNANCIITEDLINILKNQDIANKTETSSDCLCLIQECSNIIFLFLASEFTELTNQILVRDKETKQLLTTHAVQAW